MTNASWVVLPLLFLTGMVQAQIDNIYIPFRSGDNWGYADTSRNIIVSPRFDEVKGSYSGLFQVVQNGREGVVDLTDQFVVACEYDDIYIFPSVIVGVKGSERTLFSRNGKLIFKGQYDQLISPYDRLVIVGPTEQQLGLLLLNSTHDGVEKWLLDTVHNWISYRDSVFNVWKADRQYKFRLERGTTLVPLSETPMETGDEPEFVEAPPSTEQMTPKVNWSYSLKIYRTEKGQQLITTKLPDYKSKQRGWSEVRDTLNEVYRNIQVQRFTFYLTKGGTMERDRNGDQQRSFAIVTDLKLRRGIINAQGEEILAFQYDSISPRIIPIACDTPYFRVMKYGKWGVVNNKDEEVISFTHDSIAMRQIFDGQCVSPVIGIATQKNGKLGISGRNNTVLVPHEMDHIRYVPHVYYLRKGKLNGIYNAKDYCPPKYEERIRKVRYLEGYFLLELVDENNRFLGYADKKGIKYFN